MTEQLEIFEELRQPDGKKFTTIQEQFEEFHRLNPGVYRRLAAMARQLLARGRKKIGIAMLFEVLRWNYYVNTNDPSSEWKLNNNYKSRYAHMMNAESEFKGVFELRELKSQ